MSERRGEAALDDALARIHETSAVWRGELANHAPMACEALVELGRPEAIGAFLDVYGEHLEPAPAIVERPVDDWTARLGQREAAPLLIGHFLAAVAEQGVERVLGAALPRLFPGVLGGSLHGLLRTAHASRAWRHRRTEVRAREVAHALGYWASEHRALAGKPGHRPQPGTSPVDALLAIPALPEDRWVDGIISDRARASADYEPFLEALLVVDFDATSTAETIAGLTGLAASLFLSSESPRARFTYLHAVTATSALRELLPRLDVDAQRAALRHHWHALAAVRCMTATLSAGAPRSEDAPEVRPVDVDALVELAVKSRDDHAIKLTAAVLTEARHHHEPRLPMAAWAYASSRP